MPVAGKIRIYMYFPDPIQQHFTGFNAMFKCAHGPNGTIAVIPHADLLNYTLSVNGKVISLSTDSIACVIVEINIGDTITLHNSTCFFKGMVELFSSKLAVIHLRNCEYRGSVDEFYLVGNCLGRFDYYGNTLYVERENVQYIELEMYRMAHNLAKRSYEIALSNTDPEGNQGNLINEGWYVRHLSNALLATAQGF